MNPQNNQDNTTGRLKTVLEVLAEQPGAVVSGQQVLTVAVVRVPLSEWESEPLSGGVSRGIKRLSAATAKLVKDGLIVKGRGGWAITAEGARVAAAPSAVAVAGDFGQLLGGKTWDPAAPEVQMAYSPVSQQWELTVELPAGFFLYKVALNRSWAENYGAFGVRDGANHELRHDGGVVTFRYDHASHDVAVSALDKALV
ncbi:hypothetical protein BJ994_003067 [Arthrobacter pigmenti]|uniref:Amylopullulanase X25 domain-containing protein n=1 Tax=Arthrobacter pigmenti TaxID=271432 RepID=A0A846S0M6_9MICC|nr:hypothetical protein [Arthrobacter pigmenti]NJC23991.1 hypothetical protein [Arthrobacter pigmenti]